MPEIRTFTAGKLRVERRADDKPPTLTGYAAVFDQETDLGWFREVVRPGAFAGSLADGDEIRALFNHDPNLILGNTIAKTLTLAEDDTGLRFELAPPDTVAGRDLIASIERGDVRGCSFSFDTLKDTWTYEDDGDDLRELLDVRLFDVGPVTFPAYDATTVAVEGRDALAAAKESHDRWLAARPRPRQARAARRMRLEESGL